MNISRKTLCGVYALAAALALLGTWSNNLKYVRLGMAAANAKFWQETLANPASRSITVDIFFLAFAVTAWMILEARRLSMKGVWWYVLFAMLVAVSVSFPLFMIQRERALASRGSPTQAGTLCAWDMLGLGAIFLVTLAYTAVTMTR